MATVRRSPLDPYPVTPKYLQTRNSALHIPPAQFKDIKFKPEEVYGVVIDIPMGPAVLATMVCFINGAANLYFNNGGEYVGASQRYRNLVQAANALVVNSAQIIPKAEKTKQYDLPKGRTQYVYLLTKNGTYKVEFQPGLIPETEPEKRSLYVLYQRVLAELRNCQLKDDMEARKAGK